MTVTSAILLVLSLSEFSTPVKVVPFSLVNFNGVTRCELKYSAWAYNNYGCFCGYGGGGRPVDDIDRCCEEHDRCYGAARTSGACKYSFQLYLNHYSWACENGHAVCRATSSCDKALCDCDLKAVHCWKKYSKPLKKIECLRKD